MEIIINANRNNLDSLDVCNYDSNCYDCPHDCNDCSCYSDDCFIGA